MVTKKKKLSAKKAVPKKKPGRPPLKKTKSKKSPARKPKIKKQIDGYELMKSYQGKIIKAFESIQKIFDICGESLASYVYEGNKNESIVSKNHIQSIIKECKNLKKLIQESKSKLKPIYKE